MTSEVMRNVIKNAIYLSCSTVFRHTHLMGKARKEGEVHAVGLHFAVEVTPRTRKSLERHIIHEVLQQPST